MTGRFGTKRKMSGPMNVVRKRNRAIITWEVGNGVTRVKDGMKGIVTQVAGGTASIQLSDGTVVTSPASFNTMVSHYQRTRS